MMSLVTAIVAQLPAMVQLGITLVDIFPALKKSVEVGLGNGEITQADADAMHAQIIGAELAWQQEVDRARAELAGQPQVG